MALVATVALNNTPADSQGGRPVQEEPRLASSVQGPLLSNSSIFVRETMEM